MALYIPNQNNRINHAIQFATIAHGNQVRKGNEFVPYIFHPIDVANEIAFHSGLTGSEMDQALVDAILHDVIEDTAVTYENVRDQFGQITADDVQVTSKNSRLQKGEQFVDMLQRAKAAPARVQCVKLADRLSNLKTFPSFWDRDKIAQYLDEAVVIAETLGGASVELKAKLLTQVADMRKVLSLRS
ncbi:MAG: bifunctional (p)ppGpp synthetase/guanosine-3',5'-bis(diphosphate) 3'-pyrophosphohydrolase [Candidatus Kaiserbacteria bacterium]|nr:bifunctional (p)ppGpp synthetase/guanosine-3',5'-bis(diphosphate) 3'-pyrophosphohydrolase [Candidatus Kaiserbacteria bacterium]MCB9816542.1 bifunctional (p)ppGpp synthetase/guanosine-3',5'-bis(diphosphate) 3'-pyrophosphohydrolase [Candidatus Nomurabacteria bacterium]